MHNPNNLPPYVWRVTGVTRQCRILLGECMNLRPVEKRTEENMHITKLPIYQVNRKHPQQNIHTNWSHEHKNTTDWRAEIINT